MIEKDTVYGKHSITFAVVFGNPETILFGYSVRATGIERRCFRLRNFLYFSVEFRSRCLINLCFFLHAQDADSFQHTECTNGVRFSCVFRYIKRYLYMTLCGKIIDFIRLHLLNDSNERTAIRHIAIMQVNSTFLFHVAHPFVEVQVFDTSCIE